MLVLLFLGFLISASVQANQLTAEGEEFIDTYMRQFRFFNNCEPIGLRVAIEGESSQLNITEKAITNTVESRLRSARIFTDSYNEFLVVDVSIVGPAYNVYVAFVKSLEDYRLSEHLSSPLPVVGSAHTWQSGSTGVHAGQEGFILSQLSQIVDGFLVDYLKANQEKYCKKEKTVQKPSPELKKKP